MVLPGVEDVIASFRFPHRVLISEDLPTLDLPMKANSGNFRFGFCEIRVLLPANTASEIFIQILTLNSKAKIAILCGFFVIL